MNRLNATFHDPRLNYRIKENKKVFWRMPATQEYGIARIRNLSNSGMLIELSSRSNPSRGSLISFDTELGHENYIPQTGRLVWSKPKDYVSDQYICGIEFVQPAEYVLTKLRRRVQEALNKVNKRDQFRTVIYFSFFVLACSLLGYVLWMSSDI